MRRPTTPHALRRPVPCRLNLSDPNVFENGAPCTAVGYSADSSDRVTGGHLNSVGNIPGYPRTVRGSCGIRFWGC